MVTFIHLYVYLTWLTGTQSNIQAMHYTYVHKNAHIITYFQITMYGAYIGHIMYVHMYIIHQVEWCTKTGRCTYIVTV